MHVGRQVGVVGVRALVEQVERRAHVGLLAIAAALILADKSDVRRSRVRNQDEATFDIHDRVNYAVVSAELTLDPDARLCTLVLEIAPKI